MKGIFDGEVDVRGSVAEFLKSNGVKYKEENGIFRMILSDDSVKWETKLTVSGVYFIVYGVYPFELKDIAGAKSCCSEINSRLLSGGVFVSENRRAVVRSGAAIDDSYCAGRIILREFEYNCSVIHEFWNKMSYYS